MAVADFSGDEVVRFNLTSRSRLNSWNTDAPMKIAVGPTGRLYVSSDNGTTVVLQPGREYKELARNSLETFRSSLVFEGKRMYVRTTKGLWCIGE